MIVEVSKESKGLYTETYELVVSELSIAEQQFEKLRCKVYALKQAERGLGILSGKYDIEYIEDKKQFSFTRI